MASHMRDAHPARGTAPMPFDSCSSAFTERQFSHRNAANRKLRAAMIDDERSKRVSHRDFGLRYLVSGNSSASISSRLGEKSDTVAPVSIAPGRALELWERGLVVERDCVRFGEHRIHVEARTKSSSTLFESTAMWGLPRGGSPVVPGPDSGRHGVAPTDSRSSIDVCHIYE